MGKDTIDAAVGEMRNFLAKFEECVGPTKTVSAIEFKTVPLEDGATLEFGRDVSESYKIDYTGGSFTISAASAWGARNAFVTLHNLLEVYTPPANVVSSAYWAQAIPVPGVSYVYWPYSEIVIDDGPRLGHRGVMIDTTRHYVDWPTLYRIVAGMGRMKLNVFHWHATDDQSFPLVMPRSAPIVHGDADCTAAGKLCKGAYSNDRTYLASDIQNFIAYAKQHGVRVIIEIDQPSHARSWGNAEPTLRECDGLEHQNETFCLEPVCGPLALTTNYERVLEVAKTIIDDCIDLMEPGEIFHLGMDEVQAGCWGAEERDRLMRQWLVDIVAHVKTNHPENRLAAWQDGLWVEDAEPDTRAVIAQVWNTPDDATALLRGGRDIVWSSWRALYLDCGRGNTAVFNGSSWCDPYHTWWAGYMETPDIALANEANVGKVLGGEAPLWAEQTDQGNIEPLLWPRAASWGGALWEARNAVLKDPVTEEEIAEGFRSEDQLRSAMSMLRHDLGIQYTALQILWCSFEDVEFCNAYGRVYLGPGTPSPPEPSGSWQKMAVGSVFLS
eukprot:Gregarina_sp_Poly_1__3705@NODE_2095_length_2691_cov_762_070884_g1351_i0_p1_GENE_NODE_2095_length_2691_cov_762_070884_g1351_i0NODE_2095_length_2691_cov_762_070884_g1351_i0_p1_ORF_typecomplete_len612_score64_44Glyco_hydro_20/PF00728_22/4_8e65Glycohydro_20b2/PF14845_6/0_00019Glyco_hydro_20b/PF02838_15/0_0013AP_endonuc_2/PF01261_24/0_23AP_endonuc_2/PF01261_24/2_9e03_NODE_2095_length_2691_cov_762_070884_g1351_i01721836